MTDFVGVDPQRLQTLASKRRALADCLAHDAPSVTLLMGQWNSALSYTALNPPAVSQAHDDASSMSRRADLAMELANASQTPLSGGLGCLPRDWGGALPALVANPTWFGPAGSCAHTANAVPFPPA